VEPSSWKVDLVEVEVGPPAQKIALAGAGVACAQLRVVLNTFWRGPDGWVSWIVGWPDWI